ncbi:hypothetical protein HDR61_00460 [bacterium]|nr:hypothetical protein [bacterium]
MDAELQQNMQFLMGGGVKQDDKELNAADKKKLSFALLNLFYGLAGDNWGRTGKTLGAAWYDALNQMKSMIAAKDKNNPAAKYLAQKFALHNTKWSEILMTRASRDKKLELDANAMKQWRTVCAKKIGDAMNTINDAILRNAPQQTTTKPQAQTTSIQMPPTVLMKFLAMQKNKQRTA